MSEEHDRISHQLTARLAELRSRVDRIEAEQQQPLDADSSERAVAREGDEALDSIELSALLEIEHIEQALARLARGAYGLCTSCGDPIAAARLDAIPAAALCIHCAVGDGGQAAR